MFTKKFIFDVFERAIRAFALGYATQGVVGDAAVYSGTGLKYALGMALGSVVLSLAAKPFGDSDAVSVL